MSVVVQLLVFSADDVRLVSRIESALQTDVGAARMAVQLLDEAGELTLGCNCTLAMAAEPDRVAELVIGSDVPRPTWDPDREVVAVQWDFHGLSVTASATADPGVVDLLVAVGTAPLVTSDGDEGPKGTWPGEATRIEHLVHVAVDDAVTVLAGGDLIVIARPVLMEEPSNGFDGDRWAALEHGNRRQREEAIERLLGPDVDVRLPTSWNRDPSGGYGREGSLP